MVPLSIGLAWTMRARTYAMKADGDILVTLAVQFAIMSLLALGGANAVVPEMHRQAVELRGWMSDREFTDMFAMSQAAPGPNVMLVTLIGYHVAGFAGALVTTLAMCGPTAVLAHFLGRTWDRFKDAPWRMAVQAGVVPISVGLVGASAIVLTGAADHSWVAAVITVATAATAFWTRWNPLWLIGIAGSGRTHRLRLICWYFSRTKSRLLFLAESCLLPRGKRRRSVREGSA